MTHPTVIAQAREALISQIGTTRVEADTNNLWQDATDRLQTAWQSDGDPSMQAALHILEDQLSKETDPGKALQDVKDFMDKYMSPMEPSQWSSKMLIELMTNIGNITPSGKDADTQRSEQSNDIQKVQSLLNLVNAQATKESTTGQAEVKSETAMIQQAPSAQQVLADLGNSYLGWIGLTSTLLSQQYPG